MIRRTMPAANGQAIRPAPWLAKYSDMPTPKSAYSGPTRVR
jgi:hypothetical protein